MAEPGACLDCLRRSWLLAALGPYIEKIATGEVGSRSPELLRLSNEDLIEVAAPRVGEQLLGRLESLSEERLLEELTLAECWACCRHGELYPDSLRDAADAPWALIGRGDPRMLDGLEPFGTVTIVGARRATSYGREVARELGRELAGAGMVVVSGLAFGIDACAHRGAIDAGRTIAVLGCGPDVAYPAGHRSLWRQICERVGGQLHLRRRRLRHRPLRSRRSRRAVAAGAARLPHLRQLRKLFADVLSS